MKKVILHIESPDGRRSEHVGDELTLGRTTHSDIVIGDSGLSRKNTTFFRDEDETLIVDEGSTNGTFLNGEMLSGRPKAIQNGDLIKVGSNTTIRVEIRDESDPHIANVDERPAIPPVTPPAPTVAKPNPSAKPGPPTILIAAIAMTFVIIFGAVIAIVIASRNESTTGTNAGSQKQLPAGTGPIPRRVIDPLGGEDEDDLDDLIASWEVEEKELDAKTVADIKVDSTNTDDTQYNVTAAFLAEQIAKSLEPRNGETGIRPAGLNVPKELFGDGVIKQKAKLREMNANGYHQPLDFAELAEKRLNKELLEMPMATKSFYLNVGGSATEGPFVSFAFPNVRNELGPGNPKYDKLKTLAANFAGKVYDLNNPSDRKQMRIRLLRMFNPNAKPILEELANAYFGKYGRPLRVTSLTRSMDYQISLNGTNANSFKVTGEGSLPPHTSGCAFDLARRHMTAEEQNFVMNKLAEMENDNKLDALIEYGENACFHVFIYFDGKPPGKK